MRLYSVEVLIRAKQQIVVAAEDEDFAMDKAQDRIDLKEAEIIETLAKARKMDARELVRDLYGRLK